MATERKKQFNGKSYEELVVERLTDDAKRVLLMLAGHGPLQGEVTEDVITELQGVSCARKDKNLMDGSDVLLLTKPFGKNVAKILASEAGQ